MTRGLLTFSVTDAGFVYISHLYIHIKEHKRKSILLMVKFIAYIYPHPFDLVFFLPALLVPFPGFHFRVFFLMLLHYYQRPHIINWTGFLFFVMYLFVHADLFSVQISAVLGAFSTPAAICYYHSGLPSADSYKCLSADEVSALPYVHSGYSLQILTEIKNFSPPKPKKLDMIRYHIQN